MFDRQKNVDSVAFIVDRVFNQKPCCMLQDEQAAFRDLFSDGDVDSSDDGISFVDESKTKTKTGAGGARSRPLATKGPSSIGGDLQDGARHIFAH